MLPRAVTFVMLIILAAAAWGGEAAPAAEDPALERRVMTLSAELRCLVCQNQSLADSNAPLAVDLRNQVRDKKWEAAGMEVYAAMVDRMDQGIGKIVAELKRTERLDNTLIFYLQDNGGCAEGMGRVGNPRHPNIKRPDKPTLPPLAPEAFITGGPVVAAVLEGLEAIRVVRDMLGATNGLNAAAGTIRGDFSSSRQMNLVHGSDGPDAAKREIETPTKDESKLRPWLDVVAREYPGVWVKTHPQGFGKKKGTVVVTIETFASSAGRISPFRQARVCMLPPLLPIADPARSNGAELGSGRQAEARSPDPYPPPPNPHSWRAGLIRDPASAPAPVRGASPGPAPCGGCDRSPCPPRRPGTSSAA